MPRCLRSTFLMIGAACALLGQGHVATAGDTIEILPDWPVRGSRRTIVRGPTRAPAALRVPEAAKPLPPREAPPTTAPPRHVDEAVQVTTFRSAGDSRDLFAELTPSTAEVERASATESSLALPQAFSPEQEPSPSDIAASKQSSDELPIGSEFVANEPATGNGPAPSSPQDKTTPRLLSRGPTPPRPVAPQTKTAFFDASWSGLSSESVTTVGASLGVVIGAVLLLAYIWRRAAPRSAQPLPSDVMSVIGRFPLAGRQMAQLVKLGSKLVLVSITPEGVKPITEVTDPEEVTRILGLCEQNNPHSASAAFRDVFDQLIREPASSGFLGEETALIDRQKLADAYANTPGGRAYG